VRYLSVALRLANEDRGALQICTGTGKSPTCNNGRFHNDCRHLCRLRWGILGKHHASAENQLPGIGQFERIILPTTARSLRDVRDFIVEMHGPDDYGRVFVNNYLVINKEDSTGLVPSAPPEIQEKVRQHSIDRRVNLPLKAGVKAFLKKGTNFIVTEVENSQGPCSMGIDIVVNGVPLRSFPRSLPEGFEVEDQAVNVALLRELRRLDIQTLDDALCSRKIFKVVLD
jgi:hypothetical protein